MLMSDNSRIERVLRGYKLCNGGDQPFCDKCPYYSYGIDCVDMMMKDAKEELNDFYKIINENDARGGQ